MPGRMKGMYLRSGILVIGYLIYHGGKVNLRHSDVLGLDDDWYNTGTACKEWKETIH